VSIMVDGQTVFRRLLGDTGAIQADFDFMQAVHPGTHLDFVVDPGPGLNIDFDATTMNVTISAQGG